MRKTLSVLVLLFAFVMMIQLPVTGAAEEWADGDYKLDFVIYKQGTDEPSVMYDYVVQSSGLLRVENGKKYVSFVLKQSAQIIGFQTAHGDEMTDTTVVSSDPADNTRRVEFEVDDLAEKVGGWVKIYWQLTPTFLYDHEYNIELGFDLAAQTP